MRRKISRALVGYIEDEIDEWIESRPVWVEDEASGSRS